MMSVFRVRNFIIVFIVMAIIIAFLPSSTSSGDHIIVKIKFVLEDGTPLVNATVVYKPSRVSSTLIQNITDDNGEVTLHIPSYANNSIYHPIIMVKYSIYGNVFEEKYNSIGEIPPLIQLDYVPLRLSFNVTDEYRVAVAGNYTLYYNGIVLRHRLFNSTIMINGVDDKGLLLLYSISDDSGFNEKYSLSIVGSNYSVTYRLTDIPPRGITVDLHSPRVKGMTVSYKFSELAEVLYLYGIVNYTDGIFTDRVNIKPWFIIRGLDSGSEILISNSKIYVNKSLSPDHMEAAAWLKASVMLAEIKDHGNFSVTLNVVLSDDKGHSTLKSVTKMISYSSMNGVSNEQNNTTVGRESSSTPQSQHISNVSRRGGGSSGFSVNSGSSENMFLGIYYIGPVLGIIVLILEFNRGRSGRETS